MAKYAEYNPHACPRVESVLPWRVVSSCSSTAPAIRRRRRPSGVRAVLVLGLSVAIAATAVCRTAVEANAVEAIGLPVALAVRLHRG